MARTTERKEAENKEFAGLAQFCDRLKDARRYLVGRIAEDDDPSRKIPDTGWIRILASLQTCLEAVEAVMAEDRGDSRRAP